MSEYCMDMHTQTMGWINYIEMQGSEAGGYWLDHKNAEFDQIQYYLKTCLLDRGVAQNLEVWKIENTEGNYKYERKTTNMLKVACWVHSNSIEGCTLEDICTRGVRFDKSESGGMEFKTGIIEFSSELALYTSYCLVYFEVAVGRSYVFDGDVKTKKLPAGYDSFYLPPFPLDRNNDGEFDLQEYQAAAHFDNRDPTRYRHRYFVKDAVQVCAKYVVRFDLGKKVPGGTIGFSPTGAPKMIDSGAEGEEEDLSMFDPITLTAVSKRAAQQLSSTNGGGLGSPGGTVMNISGTSNNNTIPIVQAFNQSMEDFYLKDKDPVTLSKRDWTARQLSILEDKVREVNLNYAEISEAIEQAAAKAMAKLQAITRAKLETCLSMEIELRRESEQLAWLDAHIEAQMRDAQAAAVNTTLLKSEQQRRKLDFIKSWKYYTIFRNSASRSKPTELQALSSLHGDTKIHADIQIFADPFYSGGSNSLSNTTGSTAGSNNTHSAGVESHFPMQPYAVPAQPTEILVSASLQSLVDAEMEAIQRAVRAAVEGDGPPLPRTVERPLIGGDKPYVPLHDLLDRLVEEDIQMGDPHQAPQHGYGYGQSPNGAYGQEEVYGEANGHQFTGDAHQMPPMPDSESLAGWENQLNHTHSPHGNGVESQEAAFARSLMQSTTANGRNSPPHDIPGMHNDAAHANMPAVYAQDRSGMAAFFSSASSVASHQPPSHAGGAPINDDNVSAVGSMPARKLAARRASAESQSVVTQNTSVSKRDAPPPNMNTRHQGKVIYMDRHQLQQFASTKSQHSLSEIGGRKRKQMLSRSALPSHLSQLTALTTSSILQLDEVEDLFFSLPFFTKPPTLKLIYSTLLHYRSLEELLSKTFKHRGACLLLLKSGEFSFGAYLTHQLAPTYAWTGSPSCFLFSSTLGLKLPYHARTAAEATQGAPVSPSSPLAYFVQPDAIFIGNGDLSIDAELASGSSELENFYGVGCAPRSPEALCLLAGTPVFNIDAVEVWSITT